MANATPTWIVNELLTLAVTEPTLGCRQYVGRLSDRGQRIGKSTVQDILVRHGLGRRHQRVARAAALAATLVVVEHDLPLILSISDRIYCLEAGRVIAQGAPHDVRNDPRVISSYLGTDDRAIHRSNAR